MLRFAKIAKMIAKEAVHKISLCLSKSSLPFAFLKQEFQRPMLDTHFGITFRDSGGTTGAGLNEDANLDEDS